MDFQVGDAVVHPVYGLGQVIELDEKKISGKVRRCYVVQASCAEGSLSNNLTIWVPADGSGPYTLRQPTPPREFKHLFAILSSPGEPLSADRMERKMHLQGLMREGTLAAICRVIRDLSQFSQTHRLNDQDATILGRAKDYLIKEWRLSLCTPRAEAEQELARLLAAQRR